ncbi:hypothetical protein BDK51DRAFT_31473 [Blyttiomyces helicus]|uniref:BAG domain-containing protein n=1 Tax=Blyttiomyces helicus TaxID=388810 RepID=A0A4P9W891_9FUNG|nr:hypothetical protein BDK51DRAFT_31473 [Blyttiomyces helicus]|eukprot:RKO88741.1 hypothetical protein BDK51DRAFT_31473 [Blyttiomyces helicus]
MSSATPPAAKPKGSPALSARAQRRAKRAGIEIPAEEGAEEAKEEKKKAPRIIKKAPGIPAPAALAGLREVLADLTSLRLKHEKKVLTTPVRKEEDGTIAPHRNKALFTYEEALLALLIRLDGIDVEGIPVVKNARRNAVVKVQERLKRLDACKKGRGWDDEDVKELGDAEEAAEVAAVVETQAKAKPAAKAKGKKAAGGKLATSSAGGLSTPLIAAAVLLAIAALVYFNLEKLQNLL